MKTLKENEYQCVNCKGIFEYGWDDSEARKEAENVFGKPIEDWKDDAVIVCDDCYQKINPLTHPEELAYAKSKI